MTEQVSAERKIGRPKMSQHDDEFLEKLEAIRRSYMEGAFPQQLRDVNDAIAAFVHPADDGGSSLETVHAVAHKLAGSSGTFGLLDLSVSARELSELTDTRQSSVSDFSGDIGEKLISMLEDLNSIAGRVTTNPGVRGCDSDDTVRTQPNPAGSDLIEVSGDQTVIFFDVASNEGDRLDELMSNNGYKVARIDSVDSLGEAIAGLGTVVVVADLRSYRDNAEAFDQVFQSEKRTRGNGLTCSSSDPI